VRGNLPRPARPAPSPTPAQPQPVRRRKRSPFGFLSRLTPRFVGDIISELRKVTWPTFAETRYLTVVVAIVALIMGIFLGLIDLFFGWAVERLFF
jgi:preprotein translocase SecE subunit